MERWILIFCHDRPELTDLHGEWQKEGIFVHTVYDAGELSGQIVIWKKPLPAVLR